MIWRSNYHKRVAQLLDLITVIAAFLASFMVWNILFSLYPNSISTPFHLRIEHILLMFYFAILYVIIFNLFNAYSYQRFTSIITEFGIVLKVTLLGVAISLTNIFLIGYGSIPRILFVLAAGLSTIFLITQKFIVFYIAKNIRRKGKNRKRIILAGTEKRSMDFLDKIEKNFGWGLDVIGILGEDKSKVGNYINGIKVLDSIDNIECVIKEYNPEEIIITISTKYFDQIRYIIEVCEQVGLQVRLNSDFFGRLTKNIKVDNIFGLNIISFIFINQNKFELTIKRILDFIISFLMLLLLFPLFLIISLIIFLQDGRPILYPWKIMGQNRKPINSWKFRTMVKNADELKKELIIKNEMTGPVFKLKNDPRILPIGKFLRRFSLDELPQLFSVLKGDLSLVGPRPPLQYEYKEFDLWHRRKLSVKPGLTCLWQISGRNNISSFDEWVKLDFEYIDNWSLALDFKILLKTIPAVLSGNGAK